MRMRWKPISQAAEFQSLYPGFTRLPPPPRFTFGSFPADVAANYYMNTAMWSIGVHVGRELGLRDGYVFDPDGSYLIAADLKIHPNEIETLDPLWLKSVPQKPVRKVAGNVASIIPPGPPFRIYGHWLIDILPRLAVLDAAGYDLNELWFPVPEETPAFALELLELFGIPKSRILFYAAGEFWRTDTLLMPTLIHNSVQCSPFLKDFVAKFKRSLRSTGRAKLSDDAPTRLFLSRRGGLRRLINRDSIESIAQNAGFVLVRPETMSLPDQFALFAAASDIIGEYGSAFHTTVFSAPDTVVCGLRGSKIHPGFIQSAIGDALGQPTGWVFGDSSTEPDSDDFSIDERVFQDCLQLAYSPNSNVASYIPPRGSAPRGASPAQDAAGQQVSSHGITIADLEERTGLPAREFISKFENLGTNCEFGFVQRGCGAEPLSLLRFAGIPLAKLVRCLRNRFEDFGLIENLDFSLTNTRIREYKIIDRTYAMEYHTWTYEGQVDEATLVPQHAARLEFLKRKLIKSLESGSYIFVWKSHLPIADGEVLPLYDAINTYADNTLLWVVQASSAHPPGMVERVGTRLLKGYIDRFAPPDNVPDVSHAVWRQLCLNAYLEARHEMPGQPSSGPAKSFTRALERYDGAVTRTRFADIMAHIQNRDDTVSDADGWVGTADSKLAVEGFAILDSTDVPQDAIMYQALLTNFSLSEPSVVGEFQGSRGQNRPILGFLLSVEDRFAEKLHVTYEAQFVDGTRIGPIPAGVVCKASSGAALETFRVIISDKQQATASGVTT